MSKSKNDKRNQKPVQTVDNGNATKKAYKDKMAGLKSSQNGLYVLLYNWVNEAFDPKVILDRKTKVVSMITFPLDQKDVSDGLKALGLSDYQLIQKKETPVQDSQPAPKPEEDLDMKTDVEKIDELLFPLYEKGIVSEEQYTEWRKLSLAEVQTHIQNINKAEKPKVQFSDLYKKSQKDSAWYQIPGRDILISKEVDIHQYKNTPSLVGTVKMIKCVSQETAIVSVKVDETTNGKPSLSSETKPGTYEITKAFHLSVPGKAKAKDGTVTEITLDRFVITGLKSVQKKGAFADLAKVELVDTSAKSAVSMIPKKTVKAVKETEELVSQMASLLELAKTEDEFDQIVTLEIVKTMSVSDTDIQKVFTYYQTQISQNFQQMIEQLQKEIHQLESDIQRRFDQFDQLGEKLEALHKDEETADLKLDALQKKVEFFKTHNFPMDAIQQLEAQYKSEKANTQRLIRLTEAELSKIENEVEVLQEAAVQKIQQQRHIEEVIEHQVEVVSQLTQFEDNLQQVIFFQKDCWNQNDEQSFTDLKDTFTALGYIFLV